MKRTEHSFDICGLLSQADHDSIDKKIAQQLRAARRAHTKKLLLCVTIEEEADNDIVPRSPPRTIPPPKSKTPRVTSSVLDIPTSNSETSSPSDSDCTRSPKKHMP